MSAFDCIEVLEVNGRVEILCNSEENSPAWRAYVAVRDFDFRVPLGVPTNPLQCKEVPYTAEWKMYVLEEL